MVACTPPPPRRADCVLDLISTGHSCLCRFPGCWVLPVVRPLCAGSDGPPAARRSQGRLHAGQASAPAALPRHGGGGQQLPCPSIPGELRNLTMQRPTLQERCPCCLHAWSAPAALSTCRLAHVPLLRRMRSAALHCTCAAASAGPAPRRSPVTLLCLPADGAGAPDDRCAAGRRRRDDARRSALRVPGHGAAGAVRRQPRTPRRRVPRCLAARQCGAQCADRDRRVRGVLRRPPGARSAAQAQPSGECLGAWLLSGLARTTRVDRRPKWPAALCAPS